MKLLRICFYIFIGFVVTLGCAPAVRSIASFDDKKFFDESPSIVYHQDRCFLRFVYTTKSFAHFMMCESKIKNDSLLYYLPVTSSSGDRRGQIQFQEVVGENEVQIIKKGKVFWKEPNGNFVLMKVEQVKTVEVRLLPKQ